ncbi:MAG: hypothetical protein OES47_12620 [Acidobacteriota bacterium]|nr:hypothetical protein [Acidobacteriota bacterium]
MQTAETLAEAETDHLRTRRDLEEAFSDCRLVRSFRRAAYDPGDRLEYEVTGVVPAHTGRVAAEVERFVGGGFAGQVYRIRILEIESDEGDIEGLEVGGHYAIKILSPASGFARLFRNFLYFIGYQCAFSAQVLPEAVRTGVLWQKLIRRAAATKLGDGEAVCDTYATFFDAELHSFGEINEWIDGRIWKFEADDRFFARWDFDGEPPPDHNCPEYVHKKLFMGRLVELLHELGASELARQYQWWTCKSQPNMLKRVGAEGSPNAGLTAVDFRAGLALLPFLPMSPADPFLILRGLTRGRLVQFDRCDTRRLRRFAEASGNFEDLQPAIEELERQDTAYRASQPDVTSHHVRLLTSRKLRRSIKAATITAWKNLGRLDTKHEDRLRSGKVAFALLYPLSFIPFLGAWIIGLWGNAAKRHHTKQCLTRPAYLVRAMRGSRIEALVSWTRDGRVAPEHARRLVRRPARFWTQNLLLGRLPPGWHRFLANPSWAWGRVRSSFAYAIRFLRHPSFREEVLLEQVRLGHEEGMLSDAETEKIEGQIKDPFIQKYLRCLAVHICTVPVTQVVMVLVAVAVAVYCLVYRDLSWPQSMAYASAAAAAIQLLPISPGSIARGLFVLFLMIKERDVRNYYIAAPVSFLHVIGYLAFPLQMVTYNPALARFLAGRWTRRTSQLVPVFGESGALLEHGVFDLFFNLPVSMARGVRERPFRWVGGMLTVGIVTAALLLGAFARLWEWRQPQLEHAGVTVSKTVGYYSSGGDIHWSRKGMRVHLDGVDGVVDFPARHWDPSVQEGDTVDVVIRRSFFGNQYDGLAISRRASSPP